MKAKATKTSIMLAVYEQLPPDSIKANLRCVGYIPRYYPSETSFNPKELSTRDLLLAARIKFPEVAFPIIEKLS